MHLHSILLHFDSKSSNLILTFYIVMVTFCFLYQNLHSDWHTSNCYVNRLIMILFNNKKPIRNKSQESVIYFKLNGGPDGNRTRDLLRDRQAC